MKKIISIIGARPQFIKHAPMQIALQKHFNALTIHTGQHFDQNMSDVFFEDLKIPKPDYMFNIGGSKPQGEQTGIMMTEIEKVCTDEKPDALLVYGDTNSTLAGTLIAAKMNIPLIHVEAGLRSYNRTMPEEVNRIIADEFAYLLFCPTSSAIDNLRLEGITHDRIYLCGDVMYDMLKLIEPQAQQLVNEPYYFVTLHRPYNTDDKERLSRVLNALNNLNKRVVFPMHPRTIARMKSFDMHREDYTNIEIIEPIGYLESVSYQKYADAVITDSGGMQKEAYLLKKKCVTIRTETEWQETLNGNWNTLVFENLNDLESILLEKPSTYTEGIFGNGNAATEITELIMKSI